MEEWDLLNIVYGQLMLNQDDINQRYQMIHSIEYQLHKIWKGCNLILYGSFHQGLSWKGSDVDLCVKTKNGNPPTWNEIDQFIKNMQLLNQFKTTFIGTAKIPLIILYDTKYRVKVDITFSYYNPSCLQDSTILKNVADQYGESFQVIIIFVKYLIWTHDLCHNQTILLKKGLSSYHLILMTIHFFHHKYDYHYFKEKKNHEWIMDDFKKFLYFYAYLFTNHQILKNININKNEDIQNYSCHRIVLLFRYIYSCFKNHNSQH